MQAGREIVVGVDGSSSGWAALSWAATEAELRHARLVVLRCVGVSTETPWHGEPPPRPQSDHSASAYDLLDNALARIRPAHPDLPIHRSVLGDSPPDGLLSASQTADLIVVGNRGLTRAPGLLLGSTALQVVLHAECPVAVIPHRVTSSAGQFPDDIIVGVDGSDCSEAALAFACDEADRRSTGVVGVHGTEDATVDDPFFSIDATVAPWQAKYPHLQLQTLVTTETAATALRKAATGAQMLVVGNRGHGGFAGLELGSVALAAVQNPECPVVVIRGAAVTRR